MKVLVLDETFPLCKVDAEEGRGFDLYCRLAKRWDVHYLARGSASEPLDRLRACGITPIVLPARAPQGAGADAGIGEKAALTALFPFFDPIARQYRKAAREAAAALMPDLIIARSLFCVGGMRGFVGSPVLLADCSGSNASRPEHQRFTETYALRRLYLAEQEKWFRRFEQLALARVDGVAAATLWQLGRLREWAPALPVSFVPDGLDLDQLTSTPPPQPLERRHLVFTGSMDQSNYQDAARYFVFEILPRLKRRRPDLECTFAGSTLSAEVQAFDGLPGVRVTSNRDERLACLKRAATHIAPLRAYDGNHRELLEVLAMGRAVVATPAGVAGLPVESGRHLLIGDTPAEFAAAIEALLDDPIRCESLGEAARSLVAAEFSWDAIANRFAAFAERLIATRLDNRSRSLAWAIN